MEIPRPSQKRFGKGGNNSSKKSMSSLSNRSNEHAASGEIGSVSSSPSCFSATCEQPTAAVLNYFHYASVQGALKFMYIILHLTTYLALIFIHALSILKSCIVFRVITGALCTGHRYSENHRIQMPCVFYV